MAGQERFAEAEDLMLANVETVHQALDERSIVAVESLRNRVSLYEAQGRSEQAAMYRERLSAVEQSTTRNAD